ncbi:hypothetical protein ACFV7R_05135 [Streptomyces sp. NPDC059866]|uniref:hypothetical protein n=1 Tax=Streptomyces sp. NPDC059866 TaxID=3346978 RepID=UPI003663E3F8
MAGHDRPGRARRPALIRRAGYAAGYDDAVTVERIDRDGRDIADWCAPQPAPHDRDDAGAHGERLGLRAAHRPPPD